MSGDRFLDGAARIGARLVREALWDGDVCTWTVQTPSRVAGRSKEPVAQSAGGDIYQGTAGIGLFLVELYRLTRESAIRRAAVGALRHAVAQVDSGGSILTAFYAGGVGIAYAAARGGELLEVPSLTRAARALLERLRDHDVASDLMLDVIAGAAGAIPPLLLMSRWFEDGLTVATAVRLGDRIIARARREPIGWSWDGAKGVEVRNLTGYAHGASGFAHALIELYARTGAAACRYAAKQAFEYERQFFDPVVGNWPDFRHEELMEYVYERRVGELADRLRAGDLLAPYTPHHMTAWCHGAPGIGLARLRAFEVFGEAQLEAEARAALTTTRASLGRPGNFSLCHGLAGNCETLLLGSVVLGDRTLRDAAAACGESGLASFESAGRPWPCGTLGGVRDPSLLPGEAGIGYFLLRLHDSETPSVLFPCTSLSGASAEGERDRADALQRGHMVRYFGRSLAVLERFGIPLLNDSGVAPVDPASAVHALRQTAAMQTDPLRTDLMVDAARVDLEAYGLALSITDFTGPFRDRLAATTLAGTVSDEDVVVLATTSRIVRTAHDWDAWLQSGSSVGTPAREPAAFALFRRGNEIVVQRLGGFAEAVLGCLDHPTSVGDVIARLIRENMDTPVHRAADVADAVRTQINHAVAAGIVMRCEHLGPRPSRRDSVAAPAGAGVG